MAPKPPEQLMLPGMRNMQHRQFWPHGYTPDRLDAVRDAMPQMGRANVWDTPEYRKEQDQLTKAVARSSVPTRDLRGLREIRTGVVRADPSLARIYDPDRHNGVYNYDHPNGPTIGLQHRYAQPIKVEGGRGARQAARNQRDHTLIHEIGHHADFMARPRTGASSDPSQGYREAVAENYALTHGSKRGRPAVAGYDEASSDEAVFNDKEYSDYIEHRRAGTMPQMLRRVRRTAGSEPVAPERVRMTRPSWPKHHQEMIF